MSLPKIDLSQVNATDVSSLPTNLQAKANDAISSANTHYEQAYTTAYAAIHGTLSVPSLGAIATAAIAIAQMIPDDNVQIAVALVTSAVSGAETGAAIGALFGPAGAVIGTAIGAVVGAAEVAMGALAASGVAIDYRPAAIQFVEAMPPPQSQGISVTDPVLSKVSNALFQLWEDTARLTHWGPLNPLGTGPGFSLTQATVDADFNALVAAGNGDHAKALSQYQMMMELAPGNDPILSNLVFGTDPNSFWNMSSPEVSIVQQYFTRIAFGVVQGFGAPATFSYFTSLATAWRNTDYTNHQNTPHPVMSYLMHIHEGIIHETVPPSPLMKTTSLHNTNVVAPSATTMSTPAKVATGVVAVTGLAAAGVAVVSLVNHVSFAMALSDIGKHAKRWVARK